MYKPYLYLTLVISCVTPFFSQPAAEAENKIRAEQIAQKPRERESLLHRQARELREVVAAAKQRRRAELREAAHYTRTNNGLIKISLTNIADPSSGKMYSYDQYTQLAGKRPKKDIIFAQTAYTHDKNPVYSRFTYRKAQNAFPGSFVVDPYTEWIKIEDEFGDVDFERLSLEEWPKQKDAPLEFLDLSANPFIRVK